MRARRRNLGWVLGVCSVMLWFGNPPAFGLQAGITLEVHQDIFDEALWPNDFHIEGLICSSDGNVPVVIDHIDDLFAPNFVYTVTKLNPADPADCWYWFEATWQLDQGVYIPYCSVLHLGLLFDVNAANVIIDLIGWWTRDGVPVGSIIGSLRNAGYVPMVGFNVADVQVPQILTLGNGLLPPFPPLPAPPAPTPPWPPAPIEYAIVKLDVVPFPAGMAPDFREMYEGGAQQFWPWVPVADGSGVEISPLNPYHVMPDSFFDVFLSVPAPGQPAPIAPVIVEPGGFLVARQRISFLNNTGQPEERWFWEVHGAQEGEACCLDDGSCQFVAPPLCYQLNGIPQGPGTICLGDGNGNGVDDACEQLERGACCYGDGTIPIQCVITTEAECLQLPNGEWKGPGTNCDDLNGNLIADICEEQEEGDWGDAPEEALAYPFNGVIGQYPTCMNVGPPGSFIHHVNLGPYFGPMVDGENEGNASLCPLFNPNRYNQDECFQDGDAGLLFPPGYTIRGPMGLEQIVPCNPDIEGSLGQICQTAMWGTNIDVHVVNNQDREAFVNVLVDWDQNGAWGGFSPCPLSPAPEHVLIDFPIPPGFFGPLSALGPPSFLIGPNPKFVWARISITDRPVNMPNEWDGSGVFEQGETEDYLLRIDEEQEPRHDYGDAPEEALAYSTGVIGMFPTCMNVGPIGSYIQHGLGWARFGQGWDPEYDGNGGLCPMFAPYDNDECFQDGDAGLIMPEPFTIQGGVEVPCPMSAGTPLGLVCQPGIWGGNIDILVINNMPVDGFVNVLMDWDQNGTWGGVSSCPGGTITPEHVLVDFIVPAGFSGPLSALGPPSFLIGPNPDFVWARFSITERPVGVVTEWDGSGIFEDGETEDYLLLIEEEQEPQFDYGDAPEEALAYSTGVIGMFPTCMNVGPIGSYIQHGLGWARFGQGWDPEYDGNGGLCPMFAPYDNDECFQDGDAGLIMPEPFTIQGGVEVPCPMSAGTPLGLVCQPGIWGGNIDILVINNMPVDGFVNVLMDWDQNGVWGGVSSCPGGTITPEHVLVDFIVPAGFSGPLSALLPPAFLIGPNPGFVWARFSITERPVGTVNEWDGSGIFEDGETEDYLLLVEEDHEPRFDFGDAPEEALAYSTGVIGLFPTCMNVGPIGSYIQHALGTARFGNLTALCWDPEIDGNGGLCPMFGPYDNDECFRDGDAGLIIPEPFTIQGGVEVPCPMSAGTPLGLTCQPGIWGGNVDIDVINNMPNQLQAYVNVLVDWNQDGVWGGMSTCPDGTVTPEHVLVDFPVPAGYAGPLSGLLPPSFLIGPNPGFVWARFSITERPVGAATIWDGSGIFEDGETEDYLLLVEGDTTPPEIVGPWLSWKTHGSVLGPLPIPIPQGVQPNNRHIIEPRQGSVTDLTFTFSEPINPATFDPTKVRVCGLNSIPGNPATVTLSAGPNGPDTEARLRFLDLQIPNGQGNASAGDCYVAVVSTTVTDVAGNPLNPATDRIYFAASFGNVFSTGVLNNWKKVNANDRGQVVLNYTNTPTAAQAVAYDVWIQGVQAGRINANDSGQIVLSYSTVDLNNAVLPTCP